MPCRSFCPTSKTGLLWQNAPLKDSKFSNRPGPPNTPSISVPTLPPVMGRLHHTSTTRCPPSRAENTASHLTFGGSPRACAERRKASAISALSSTKRHLYRADVWAACPPAVNPVVGIIAMESVRSLPLCSDFPVCGFRERNRSERCVLNVKFNSYVQFWEPTIKMKFCTCNVQIFGTEFHLQAQTSRFLVIFDLLRTGQANLLLAKV